MNGISAALLRRRRRNFLSALALLALLCRALIPAGFMPGVVHGSAGLMLCDGVTHEHHHAGQPEPATHTPCPFAMSGHTAVLSTPACDAILHEVVQRTESLASNSLPSQPPRRHTAARGPPLLA
jgi:hypothetical protein